MGAWWCSWDLEHKEEKEIMQGKQHENGQIFMAVRPTSNPPKKDNKRRKGSLQHLFWKADVIANIPLRSLEASSSS